MKELKSIKYWIFDLDNTLYSGKTKVFEQVDKKMIKIVEEIMIEFNKEIIKALEKKSCKAKSKTIKENNIIYVEQENKELGYVGKPVKVNTDLLNDIIQKDFIPIVTPMGLDQKGPVSYTHLTLPTKRIV